MVIIFFWYQPAPYVPKLPSSSSSFPSHFFLYIQKKKHLVKPFLAWPSRPNSPPGLLSSSSRTWNIFCWLEIHFSLYFDLLLHRLKRLWKGFLIFFWEVNVSDSSGISLRTVSDRAGHHASLYITVLLCFGPRSNFNFLMFGRLLTKLKCFCGSRISCKLQIYNYLS